MAWISSPPEPEPSLRTVLAYTATIDVSGSAPPLPEHARNGAAASTHLRPYLSGVTQEHPGRYHVRESMAHAELGRGGLGRVFVAQDLHLGRDVAIKELLPEVLDASNGGGALQALSRFLREAQVTGGLEHPNIVPVYELGRRADGTLYYTMRVVRGRTLARAIHEASDLNARLSLVNHFSGLCQAIAYAHSRGIVHRDIKPDNVMIGEFGETVVLDWGMAKICGGEAADEVLQNSAPVDAALDLTVEGSLCGTPLYMSPEQALGQTREVDERSDVWSLGVVLYTILAGTPPFSAETFLGILAQVKAARFTPLRQLDARIPAELAAVVERALCADKQERYPSGREIARDVQAYQAGARVEAYEYSSLELLQRFVARQRSAVTASLLAIVAIVALSAVWYRRVVTERDRAVVAEQKALQNELAAKKSEQRARHSLGEVLVERAEQALAEGDTLHAELLAGQALGQEERADARGVVLAAQSSLRPEATLLLTGTAGCTRQAVSLLRGLFACARGEQLELWDLRAQRKQWAKGLESEVATLALSSDGGALAFALVDGTLRLQRTESAGAPALFEATLAKPTAIALSARGDYLACGAASGELRVWPIGLAQREWKQHLSQPVSALAFAGNGTLAFGGVLGALGSWEFERSRRLDFAGHTGTVRALAFAHAGRYLASAGADRSVRFWDAASGAPLLSPIVHADAISSLSWSEDARYLTFGSKDKSFRVSDLRSSKGRGALVREHDEAVDLVALSPDASELASFSKESGLRLWSLASMNAPSELSDRGNVLALDFSGSGQLISGGLGSSGVCIWDLASGACSTRLPARLDRVRALAVSRDGRTLALAGSERQAYLWDLTQRVPSHVLAGLSDEARALTFSSNGEKLAVAGLDGSVRVFDRASGVLWRELPGRAPLQSVTFLPNSLLLVAGDREGWLSLWDAPATRLRARWRAHQDWVLSTAAAPDGGRIASAGADRLVKIWDSQTGKMLRTLAGHEGKVLNVDFSRDGKLLASAGEDKAVRLWNSASGASLARLTGHEGAVRAVRFAPGDECLASGSDDGTIRLWKLKGLALSSGQITELLNKRALRPPARTQQTHTRDVTQEN